MLNLDTDIDTDFYMFRTFMWDSLMLAPIISYVNQTNIFAYSHYICAGGDGCNRIVVCKPRVFKDTLGTVELGWDELQE